MFEFANWGLEQPRCLIVGASNRVNGSTCTYTFLVLAFLEGLDIGHSDFWTFWLLDILTVGIFLLFYFFLPSYFPFPDGAASFHCSLATRADRQLTDQDWQTISWYWPKGGSGWVSVVAVGWTNWWFKDQSSYRVLREHWMIALLLISSQHHWLSCWLKCWMRSSPCLARKFGQWTTGWGGTWRWVRMCAYRNSNTCDGHVTVMWQSCDSHNECNVWFPLSQSGFDLRYMRKKEIAADEALPNRTAQPFVLTAPLASWSAKFMLPCVWLESMYGSF